MADSPLPYATPRRELVRQCCEAALMWYRVFGDLSASRDWLDKARMWRDHYAREIEANNAYIRANPAIAARWKLRETQPHPETDCAPADWELAFSTPRGLTFWRRDDGTGQAIFQATSGNVRPNGGGGYYNLQALMKLKGEPAETADAPLFRNLAIRT